MLSRVTASVRRIGFPNCLIEQLPRFMRNAFKFVLFDMHVNTEIRSSPLAHAHWACVSSRSVNDWKPAFVAVHFSSFLRVDRSLLTLRSMSRFALDLRQLALPRPIT